MSASPVDEILGQLPLDQLAAQLGVDPQTAARAAAAVIPSLIGGLQHNADQGNEQAIVGALVQHSSSNLFDSGSVDLNSVDAADGAKIVQHIFGDQSTQLAHAIGQRTGASGNLVNELLPILAPIVLAYLAKKLSSSQQSAGGSGGSILNDMLGSVLGGQGGQQAGGGGMLGSILGGILSGGVFDTTPTTDSGSATDAGSLQTDDTPAVDENASVDQQPQSGGSIVDEILGGLFGKR
jgi:hypothetical protein